MLESHQMEYVRERIATRIGTDSKTLGDLAVEGALTRRARAHGLNVESYLYDVSVFERDLDELTQLLLISESWFMRDMEPIRVALRALAAIGGQLRILSAPCAQGEEVISTALCAYQEGRLLGQVHVDGIDLSRPAIDRATTFTYSAYSFRGTDAAFQATYFDTHRGLSSLKAEWRQGIRFTQGNLIDPSWSTPTSPYHLVLCRNLLIYLTPEARNELLRRIAQAMSFDGILVVTAAESPFVGEQYFAPADARHSLYRPRLNSSRTASPVREGIAPSTSATPGLLQSQHRANFIARQVDSAVQSTSRNTTSNVEGVASGESASSPSYEEALERLERTPNDVSLLFLLGVYCSSAGDDIQARLWFERALELAPQHEEAQIYLETLSHARRSV